MNIQFSDALTEAAKANRKAIQKFFFIFLFFTVLSVVLGLLLMFCGVNLVGQVSNIWIILLGIAMILSGGIFISSLYLQNLPKLLLNASKLLRRMNLNCSG